MGEFYHIASYDFKKLIIISSILKLLEDLFKSASKNLRETVLQKCILLFKQGMSYISEFLNCNCINPTVCLKNFFF